MDRKDIKTFKNIKLPRKFRMAKLISRQSEYKIKIGAVIYKGNRVISFGFNYLKTHPQFSKEYGSIHAEISAILKSQSNLNGSHIYVYREFKNGNLANSKPCKECMKAIIASGISKIFFTINNGWDVVKI